MCRILQVQGIRGLGCFNITNKTVRNKQYKLLSFATHPELTPSFSTNKLIIYIVCIVYIYIDIYIDISMYMYILVLTLCLVYCYLQYMTLIGLEISEMVSPVNCYFSYPAMLVSILFLGCFFNHMQNTEQ